MTDIVERLREGVMADALKDGRLIDGMLAERMICERREAADEIERLRAALDDMIDLAEMLAGSDAYSHGAYHARFEAARKAYRGETNEGNTT